MKLEVGDTSNTYMGTFDIVVFRVILGSLGALVSKWHVTQKPLVVEQNGLKFGTRRY